MPTSRRLLVVLVTGIAVLATACPGGGDGDDATTTPLAGVDASTSPVALEPTAVPASPIPAQDPATPAPEADPTQTPTTVPAPTPTFEPLPPIDVADLIPRDSLLTLSDRRMVSLSPDGQRLSYLAPVCGFGGCHMSIWVGTPDDPDAAEPLELATDEGIESYFWAYTNHHIVYSLDNDGDENWRLYSIDTDTNENLLLTPVADVKASVEGMSPSIPEEILVGLNDRIPEYHDLYRINITDGERTLVQRNDEFLGFYADNDFVVRLALKFTSDGGSELLTPGLDGGWDSYIKIDLEDSLTTFPMWFDLPNETLYMMDSRGRNTAALVGIDFESGETTVVAEDARADFDDLIGDPATGVPLAAAFTYSRKEWQAIGDTLAPDLAYLSSVDDGDFQVVSQSDDNNHWVVLYSRDDGPGRYYFYDRDAGNARFMFSDQEGLEELDLARMHPVVIESRDGLELVSYLTLSSWTDVDGDLRPETPLATVLLVHGGPWSRDEWGYSFDHQLLANRGYAVLSVNFRGSTGFGKDLINAANREYAGKMHDDLIDAVDWAIDEGIADPDRVAIVGSSYGGYATLVGLTFTPEVFACGVEFAGMSNLITDLESTPPYLEWAVELYAARVGDHRTEEGRAFLTERSPLTYADRIVRPLLIGQGSNDPRVKQAESDQIVQAMQDNGIPVTYLVYPDEGHGLATLNNAASFMAIRDVFLSECLGGRHEPFGDALYGSSITVPVGAEYVPGFEEELTATFGPDFGQPAAPNTGDVASLVDLALEWALVDQEIPDYELIAQGADGFVLSLENLDEGLEPQVTGVTVIPATPKEIQSTADTSGDFLYLAFDLVDITDSTGTVWISNVWAVGESSTAVYTSGGTCVLGFTQTGTAWVREEFYLCFVS